MSEVPLYLNTALLYSKSGVCHASCRRVWGGGATPWPQPSQGCRWTLDHPKACHASADPCANGDNLRDRFRAERTQRERFECLNLNPRPDSAHDPGLINKRRAISFLSHL